MDYDDYLIQMEQQRMGPDCDCLEGDCDACEEEDCNCERHEKDCSLCKTIRGCKCDRLYDEWRDSRYD